MSVLSSLSTSPSSLLAMFPNVGGADNIETCYKAEASETIGGFVVFACWLFRLFCFLVSMLSVVAKQYTPSPYGVGCSDEIST